MMTSYKDHRLSPYQVEPRHQFAHYTHHHQYPATVDPSVTMATTGGYPSMGTQQQYVGDFPTNVYPNYYAAAVQAGIPGLSLSHHTTAATHDQEEGKSPKISPDAYQMVPTEVAAPVDQQKHCSSSRGNTPTQDIHQAVNPAYLQVSGSQGGSPQIEAEVSQAAYPQQQYQQQQYQVSSNGVM